MDSLVDKLTPRAIKRALVTLPNGTDALDQAYQDAMDRILAQKTGFRELAILVLSWITCARKRLTSLELRHALAVEAGDSELDEDNVPEIAEAVSVCAGLVTIDEESDIVRLVHYTTQEYFERTQETWFPDAQTTIATTCVTYLSFDYFEARFYPGREESEEEESEEEESEEEEFMEQFEEEEEDIEKGEFMVDEEVKERLRLHPLYYYAASNWGYHVRGTPLESKALILNFLQSDAKVTAASRATYLPKRITGLHLAARFGLAKTASELLGNGYNPNCKDFHRETPLIHAVTEGRLAVVEVLLAHPNIDRNSKDVDGNTSLSLAAEYEQKEIVQLLLAHPNINLNSKSKYGKTPLSLAAEYGHKEIVQLLLAHPNIDPNPNDVDGNTPLSLAAEYGQKEIVQLLLAQPGINVDSKDSYGRTALDIAKEEKHQEIVQLLQAFNGSSC